MRFCKLLHLQHVHALGTNRMYNDNNDYWFTAKHTISMNAVSKIASTSCRQRENYKPQESKKHHLDSQSPVILIVSIITGQAKTLHKDDTVDIVGYTPPTYINRHPNWFWGRSFYRTDNLPDAQPTVLMHWRQNALQLTVPYLARHKIVLMLLLLPVTVWIQSYHSKYSICNATIYCSFKHSSAAGLHVCTLIYTQNFIRHQMATETTKYIEKNKIKTAMLCCYASTLQYIQFILCDKQMVTLAQFSTGTMTCLCVIFTG